MKFICPAQVLSEACMNVQRATSTKSSNLPTIEGILIKAENDKSENTQLETVRLELETQKAINKDSY